MFGSQKLLRKKNVIENDFLIFGFYMEKMKENKI